MDELEIQLKNARKALRELYYCDGRQNVLAYSRTRQPLLLLTTLIFLTGVYYLFAFSERVDYIVFFTLFLLSTIICFFHTCRRVGQYLKWRRGVDEFIRETSKHKKWTLIANTETLELITDEERTIEKWIGFTKVRLSNKSIILTSLDQARYVFPAASMEPAEFQRLTAIVRERLNQPQTSDEPPTPAADPLRGLAGPEIFL